MMMNKKGQMVIFVIIALGIVVGFLIYLALKLNTAGISPTFESPQQFIQKCVRDATLEAVNKMLPQGGFVNVTNYQKWDNINVEYLCQNLGNYRPCISQHPSFINDEKTEIEKYIKPRVENCFSELKAAREKQKETFDYGPMNLRVDLAHGKIIVNIERETKIKIRDESISVNNYDAFVDSPLYDLANVANDIATSQGKYCYFEYNGYMLLYPRWKINVNTMSDSTKIYEIKDIKSGNKMNIAIRSCGVPPGGV
jgi:hypothetical protein